MIALDYGVNEHRCWHGAQGPIAEPKSTRGLSAAAKFAEALERMLSVDDVATESATLGSSGAERDLLNGIVRNSPHTLYLLSTRAVKNHCGRTSPPDEVAAQIIYELATQHPERLKVYSPTAGRRQRIHTSVRPFDKRGYRGPEVEAWMANLPPFDTLPLWVQDALAEKPALTPTGRPRTRDYYCKRVLPFAMALEEPGALTSREAYSEIIGLSEHGYPSFYRRATVALMQVILKHQTGLTKLEGVTREQRKAAWQETTRVVRCLYGRSKEWVGSSDTSDSETDNAHSSCQTALTVQAAA